MLVANKSHPLFDCPYCQGNVVMLKRHKRSTFKIKCKDKLCGFLWDTERKTYLGAIEVWNEFVSNKNSL